MVSCCHRELWLSCAETRAVFDHQKQIFKQRRQPNFKRYEQPIPNAVTATWMVSFEQIRTRYPYASDLFSLMSFLDRQEIPKAALSWISERKLSQGSSRLEQNSQAQRLLQLEKALGLLKAFFSSWKVELARELTCIA